MSAASAPSAASVRDIAAKDPELQRLLLENQRRQVRSSMLAWAETALAGVDQRPARHHRLIIDHLEMLARGDIDRLLMLAPPGSAKSTYCTVLFPAWWFCRHPRSAIISASHTGDLAAAFGRRVRNTVQAHAGPLGYSLSEDSRAANKWHTDKGGEYLAAGVGMAIAGRRADLVIIDDPVKSREEAERQGERDRVWDWYRSDLYSRTKPGARIVVIMTRWHEDDLGGRLLAEASSSGDRWTVLSLPAVCERAEGDPLGRSVGDALWPEWEDERALARKRGVVGERDWQSQYQQRPRPAQSVLFDVGRISKVSVAPSPVVSRVRAWDLAATEQLGGRDPDWTVGLRMARLESGQFLVEDVVRMRGSPWAVEQTIVETGRLDGQECPISVPQDPGQAGKSQVAYLAAALAGHVVTSSVETGSKETRAMPWASQVEAGNVLVLDRPWVKTLVDEMDAFPHGSKDDQVDAGSRAFAHLVPRQGAQAMLEYYGTLAQQSQTPPISRPGASGPGESGGEDELIEVYTQALRRIRDEEDSLCARCARPVGRTRTTDGIDVWHPECAP